MGAGQRGAPIGDEVGERPRFQRWEWRVDRVGWAVMAAVVLAGLAGVWGHGAVSEVNDASPHGRVAVNYERFVRNIGQNEMVLRIGRTTASEDAIRLRVSQRYLADNQIEAMTPEPTASYPSGDAVVFEYPGRGTGPLLVRWDLRPTGGMGAREAVVSVGSESVHLRQIVYP